jgi:hypothetical protein
VRWGKAGRLRVEMGVGFETFVEWAVRFIGAVNERAAAMDGRAAFVLGLLTWFVVEQAIRKLAGLLRIAIIVAAVGAGGLGLVAFLTQLAGEAAQDVPAGSKGGPL